MDPLTHGITGALIAKAFFARSSGQTSGHAQHPSTPLGKSVASLQTNTSKVAVVATIFGALFPDVDVFFNRFVPHQMATLELHRGVTHSLVCWPLFALGLALATQWVLRWKRGTAVSLRMLGGCYAAGLLSHIALDYVTSWGTMLAAPLLRTRFSWDLVFILDFTLTSIVLLPQAAAWVHRKREGILLRGAGAWGFFLLCSFGVRSIASAIDVPFSPWTIPLVGLVLAAIFFVPGFMVRSRPEEDSTSGEAGYARARATWCRAGFAALVLYLCFCAVAHYVALSRVEQFARDQHLKVQNVGALPMPPWLGRWMGVVRTPTGVHQSVFGLLDDGPPHFQFVADGEANPFVESAKQTPEAQTFLWFARFPVVRYFHSGGANGQHVVEFNDLRFFQRGSSRPAPFTFRVVLDDSGRVIEKGWVD